MTLHIMSRRSWKAARQKSAPRARMPVNNVYFANTNNGPCLDKPPCDDEGEVEGFEGVPKRTFIKIEPCRSLIRHMQISHMNKRLLHDICYSFLIGADGMVYEGRGWYEYPTLPPKYRKMFKKSIFVGYISEYLVKEIPSIMVQAGRDLIDNGIKNGFITENYEEHFLYKGKVQ